MHLLCCEEDSPATQWAGQNHWGVGKRHRRGLSLPFGNT